jgi:serine protease Do
MMYRFGLRAWLATLAWVLTAGWSGQAVWAQDDVGQKVYKNVLKSAVWVLVPKEGSNTFLTGTGSLVDRAKRLVITNYHVVGDRSWVVVCFPSYQQGELIAERSFYLSQVSTKGIKGRVLATDESRDLALIQLQTVPEGAQPLPLARNGTGPGQRVHSVGNSGRSSGLWLYASGMVRQVYRKEWKVKNGDHQFDFKAKVVETSSPTNAGDSGGPLVNDRGELVAVTQGGAADAQLLSYFIDVSEVKTFLTSHGVQAKLGLPATEKTAPEQAKAALDPAAAEKTAPEKSDKLEKAAATKLRFAQTLAADGKVDRAREYCQDILKTYSATEAAKEAKLLLDKLTR